MWKRILIDCLSLNGMCRGGGSGGGDIKVSFRADLLVNTSSQPIFVLTTDHWNEKLLRQRVRVAMPCLWSVYVWNNNVLSVDYSLNWPLLSLITGFGFMSILSNITKTWLIPISFCLKSINIFVIFSLNVVSVFHGEVNWLEATQMFLLFAPIC